MKQDKTTRPDKRRRLIDAANGLVLRQGFNKTTLAEVAAASEVPLGGIYYYFRTKEALGAALIEARAEGYRALRQQWDELPEPRERLLAFIQMAVDRRDLLVQSGCPIGSLCQELRKSDGALADCAKEMFAEFLEWLKTQFEVMGKGERSYELAVHLMSVLEGATLLTNSFKDPYYILCEAGRMKEWVRSM